MIEGTVVYKFDDNVDTDVIIPGQYLNIQDPEELRRHCFEGLIPDFFKRVKQGDILVAGKNFGCGSSREAAPIAIKATGISAIIAISFARIFYRNAINIGLAIFECPGLKNNVTVGDSLIIDAIQGTLLHVERNEKFDIVLFPEFIRDIIDHGGLINYGKKKLNHIGGHG
jgi:3-isopropylmalate/(R)-2-methylmalate dehydratase small subunit